MAQAFKRALVSQCHPTMLFALLLPFLIALVGALLLFWLFWTPLTDWLATQASHWDFINRTDEWLLAMRCSPQPALSGAVIAVSILLPLSGVLGLAIAAVFVMPLVLRHVSQREYALSRPAPPGRLAAAVGVWNAVWVSGAFVLGWLFTLPLWLVPPMALVLPVFWWTFAFSRMMRVDAIVEHASPAERKLILERHNGGFWTIGLICALLNLLPPAWISCRCFRHWSMHYGLDALQRLRQERIIDAA